MNAIRLANSNEPPCVGATLKALRTARGLSLEDLAKSSGVSGSMLSQIERNQTNPTVALVWRVANALGVPMAELLEYERRPTPALQVIAPHATPSLKSPDNLCALRILSPIETAGQFEWYELTVQAGGVLDSQPHEPGTKEHLTVLTGSLEVRVGAEKFRLKHGETARYAGDVAHTICSVGKSGATAVLVVIHG